MRFSSVYWSVSIALVLTLTISNLLDPISTPHMFVREDGSTPTNIVPGIDSDGDGLKDIEEDINGNGMLDNSEKVPTDPYNPDTDGDGLNDGWEHDHLQERMVNASAIPNWVLRYHKTQAGIIAEMARAGPLGDADNDRIINILDMDSDGDGLSDGAETNLGMDMLDPDTDGDTVPDPYDEANGFSLDSDLNGLDDDWEAYHGQSDPSSDPDKDGTPNLSEFMLDRDPNHPDSFPGYSSGSITGDVLSMDDPSQPMFRVQGVGPRYIKVISFDRFEEGEWQRTSDWNGQVNAVESTSQSARIVLEGMWWGELPHVHPSTDTYGPDPDRTYPHSPADLPRSVGDVVYSRVPLKAYSFDYPAVPFNVSEVSRYGSVSSVPAVFRSPPSDLSGDIWDLFDAWKQDGLTTVEKADLVSLRLSERCSYSVDSNFGQGRDDPLYRFLILTRKGSALDFASAFTVLMKAYDVPSRLVVGFALGSEDGPERTFMMGHLHVWSEIYIDEAGWVAYEPTPHSMETTGGSGITADGIDPYVLGLNGGDGGGTLKGEGEGVLDPEDDEDHDDLKNGEESTIGSDPRDPDTDNDDVEDGAEVKRWGSDPLSRDTDGDNLDDGAEINRYRTNVTDPDTDGGGLRDGMEVGQDPPLDPLDPEDDLSFIDIDGDGLGPELEEKLGTNGLDIDTDRDGLTDGEEFYTHGSDPLSTDSDNDTLTDDLEVLGGTEGMVFTDPADDDTDGDGLLDAREISLGTDPRSQDTDRDKIPDGRELEDGTDPLAPDTDSDGLLDGRELFFQTDPLLKDTDGDGTLDGYEVWWGMNPLFPQQKEPPADLDRDGLPDVSEDQAGTFVGMNDTDGDGLSDGFEVLELHTDPLLRDTDMDLLPDMEELMTLHTDPLLKDTDGDGLDDGKEIFLGTSPLLVDTDRDLCSDQAEALEAMSDPLDPDTDGGGLGDGTEIMLGRDHLDPADDMPFSTDTDGDGLPDVLEAKLGTDHSSKDTDGDGLTDGEEHSTYGTDPLHSDTDDDGLDDREEVKDLLTDPLRTDSDSDGLSDFEEVRDWRTSPTVNDTDGDGLIDGWEVPNGTSPNDPDSDSDGLSDGSEVQDIGTDPLDPDTDAGGALDGLEVSKGGDPLDPGDDLRFKDTDGDGLTDLEEDPDLDGLLETNETDPKRRDTDGDGLMDSYELWGSLGPASDPRDPDTDDDSILDGEEVTEGEDGYLTDPTRNDTDLDGLMDPEEVSGSLGRKSDPSSPDGDHDGLNDTVEILLSGTDPLDPDTDQDGLPDGWIDGWRGRPVNGRMDIGEYEDRNLDGRSNVSEDWNYGEGPGETDPLDPDTDGGGVPDGPELFHTDIRGNPAPFDPLDPLDDEFIKDSDDDGLTDMEENGSSYETRWDDPDTDNDGLLDGYLPATIGGRTYLGELEGHNGRGPTNPLDPDSDDDGTRDGDEVQNGTDPNARDTDGDGLWDGFDIVGPDRKLHEGELTPRNRFDPANPFGPSDPLDPDSDDDGLLDGISVQMPGGGTVHGEVYYGCDPNKPDTDRDGLTDQYEVTTVYPDEMVSTIEWDGETRKTNPRDPDTDDGGMPDGAEAERSLNPLDPKDDDQLLDSDGDGLRNGEERTGYFFTKTSVDWDKDGIMDHRPDPNDPDTDSDGLSDGDEVLIHHTNPMTPDSDGDGLMDKDEIEVHSTDPLDTDSDDDQLPDGTEVTHLYNTSYVDWDGDGRLDHRTDPNTPDTDMDSFTDHREVVEKGTNPLDPGDPGSEPLPEEALIVVIENALEDLRKTADPRESAFQVEGRVSDALGKPIEGVWVSIIAVERGTDPDLALSMEMNPSVRVGSTAGTDASGSFSVTCLIGGEVPAGEIDLFAVTRKAAVYGKRFLPSISGAVPCEVSSTTALTIDSGNGPYTKGATIRISGSLADAGGLSVQGEEIVVEAGWGAVVTGRTDRKGKFSTPLVLPSGTGTFQLRASFPGSDHLSGSRADFQVEVADGPVLRLYPVPSEMVVGQVLYVNGTLEKGAVQTADSVHIALIFKEGLEEVLEGSVPLKDNSFSFSITLDPGLFDPGAYLITASYGGQDSPRAENSTLSFRLLGRSNILVPDPKLIRGQEPFVYARLLTAAGFPMSDQTLSASFPGSPWLSPVEAFTNSSGWAALRVEVAPGTPLGSVTMVVVHRDPGLEAFAFGRLQVNISIMAPTSLEVEERQGKLTLLQGLVVRGRLSDDTGAGIEGEGALELLINGEAVEVADTERGGWFTIAHTVSRYSHLGEGSIAVRFTDLGDSRAGWYERSELEWEMEISSSTYITVRSDLGSLNRTVRIILRDERGAPVADAPIQTGVGLSYTTNRTDDTGNLTVLLPELSYGSKVTIRFPGDPTRYLLASQVNLTVPEPHKAERGSIIPAILGAMGIFMIVSIAAILLVRLRKYRRDLASRNAAKVEEISLYPPPRQEGPRKAIIQAFRDVEGNFRERGVGRPPNMTAHEFNMMVQEGTGNMRELGQLTDMFQEARYSDHDLSPHLMGVSKELDRKISRTLQDRDMGSLLELQRKRAGAPAFEVVRPVAWKMRVDHAKDLEELLGDKGVAT